MGGMCPKGEDNPNDHRGKLPPQGRGGGGASTENSITQSQRKFGPFKCKCLTLCQFDSIRALNHWYCSFVLD